jgi:hypothetical protein
MLWPVAYPNKDGTLVFYSSRSSTDQVSGIGTGLKLSIGREQIKKSMVNGLQRLKEDLNRNSGTVATK